MATTKSTDWGFEPKVWSDHTMAYWGMKLVYGMFSTINKTLMGEGKGLTVNFPFFKNIGPAQEPAEDESLVPDSLSDDSFTASVFEVGKTVGAKKKAFLASAASRERITQEVQIQIARVHAENVDGHLNDEITTYNGKKGGPLGVDVTKYNNMTIGFKADDNTGVMNVRNLHIAKTRAFGDKSEDAVVCFMHPLQWLDSRIDEKAGFLKADANQPYSAINGFIGRLANMAIVLAESVKKLPAQIGGLDAYLAHFHKVNSYGIIMKEEMEWDDAKDINAREIQICATQWYGVKSFHRKTNLKDKKAGGLITVVSQSLAA